MATSETKRTILTLLADRSAIHRPADLARNLQISPQALHRHLKSLLDSKQIVKLGTAPRVYYRLARSAQLAPLSELSLSQQKFLEENFSELRATGELTRGLDAFRLWLQRIKQEKVYLSLAESYILQREKANQYRDSEGFIDLTTKIKDTLENCILEKAVCQDFYSLPQFGKTYLGNLLTAAKSGQNRKCFEEMAQLFEPYLTRFIKLYKIDAIIWAPHSVPRRLMVIDQLKARYRLAVPEIKAIKVFAGGIPVAQKSLSKLNERIENAKETIHLQEGTSAHYKRVLIVDDAVGSGATLNEIAIKVKDKYSVKEVYGLAIVGSYKGFDVISVV